MRTRELEAIQQRFAMQQQRVFNVETKISEANALLKAQMVIRPYQPEESVDPVVEQQRFRYIQHLKDQIVHLKGALTAEKITLENIRKEMQKAHVKKRSLELLEEKQRRQYINMLESQEMKEIEDIVLARRHYSK